jgi:SAM-dependent methyltransferase
MLHGQMSNQKQPRDAAISGREYWDANLDPLNIRHATTSAQRLIEEEIAFHETPEHLYARHLMGTITGKRILELGAGLSVNPIILARAGARVVIADISLERLKRARSLIVALGLEEQVLFVCCAAEALALRSASLDVVYTKSVLIHTELQQAAAELRRTLQSGGSGIFVEPLRWNPFAVVYRRFFAPPEWRQITAYFDQPRIAVLKNAFGNLDNRPFYFLSFLAFYWQFGRRNLHTFSAWLRWLMNIDNFLLRLFPFLKRLCWLTVLHVRKEHEV